jgi:hypothetical protein
MNCASLRAGLTIAKDKGAAMFCMRDVVPWR